MCVLSSVRRLRWSSIEMLTDNDIREEQISAFCFVDLLSRAKFVQNSPDRGPNISFAATIFSVAVWRLQVAEHVAKTASSSAKTTHIV